MSKDFAAETIADRAAAPRSWRRPRDLTIFLVFVGIVLLCEALGWILIGQSFVWNPQRLTITILQVSVVGIIAAADWPLVQSWQAPTRVSRPSSRPSA